MLEQRGGWPSHLRSGAGGVPSCGHRGQLTPRLAGFGASVLPGWPPPLTPAAAAGGGLSPQTYGGMGHSTSWQLRTGPAGWVPGTSGLAWTHPDSILTVPPLAPLGLSSAASTLSRPHSHPSSDMVSRECPAAKNKPEWVGAGCTGGPGSHRQTLPWGWDQNSEPLSQESGGSGVGGAPVRPMAWRPGWLPDQLPAAFALGEHPATSWATGGTKDLTCWPHTRTGASPGVRNGLVLPAKPLPLAKGADSFKGAGE